jgi:GR25 family glycosyltransferase involved in LPS biosynthesis
MIAIVVLSFCTLFLIALAFPPWWERNDEENHHLDLIKAFKENSMLLKAQELGATAVHNEMLATFKSLRTHIYVIGGNQTDRPGRNENVELFVKAMGFISENIDYTTPIYAGKYLENEYKEKGILRPGKHRMWVGALGCQFSHMHVLESFLLSNYEQAIVLENDVRISAPFSPIEAQAALTHLLKVPSNQWDVQYLGFCHTVKNVDDLIKLKPKNIVAAEDSQHTEIYISNTYAMCTHAIVYTRFAAKIILDNWKPFYGSVDGGIANLICRFGKISIIIYILVVYNFIYFCYVSFCYIIITRVEFDSSDCTIV